MAGGRGYRDGPGGLPSRKPVDIEWLLQWTFREELPKKRPGGWLPSFLTPLAKLSDLGTAIDNKGLEDACLPAIFGEVHPDALTVETVIGSLADAPIDWPATRRTAIGPLGGLLADDDVTLSRLTIGLVGLVAMHARLATRPRWDLWPQVEPEVLANGKPAVRDAEGRPVKGRGGHNGAPWYTSGAYCPLRWRPEPREAAFARIEYSAWWQALDTLADVLADVLADFAPQPPAAHPSPWARGRGADCFRW